MAANWMAQHVAGSKCFTQAHTGLPVRTSRASSLRWLGFGPTALGIAMPVRMARHEETKKVVMPLMEPVAEETMVLTDACWSGFLISGNITAPPSLLGDAAAIAYSGALAMRDNASSVFYSPLPTGTV